MGKTHPIPPSAENDAEASGAGFSETQWSKLFEARIAGSTERCSILDFLIRRYWKPVYCYLRRSGHEEAEAKDLVQEFFAVSLRKDLFSKADPTLGRFRNLLLSSLKNFVANARRAALAKKRHPSKGFTPIDDTSFHQETPSALRNTVTPDEIFHRIWVQDLVVRVLKRLERDCHDSGKAMHYGMFFHYVVQPALEGNEQPHLRDLGAAHGMKPKDAANRVLTAQRAFMRLLREEIRLYATSEEEAAAELQDLKEFLLR